MFSNLICMVKSIIFYRKFSIILYFYIIYFGNLFANNTDLFLNDVLLQDKKSILNNSLPLPKKFLHDLESTNYVKSENMQEDSIFNDKLEKIKPSLTTHDYFNMYNIKNEDIESKIHELEKEAYMLKSQIIEIDNNKIKWLINKNRSGYYVGIGFLLDFRHPSNQSLGVNINGVNTAGIFKIGYLRYFNNNSGLKAEIFGLYGGVWKIRNSMQYYGTRFSVLRDVSVFSKNNYFGIFAGFGFGGYIFSKSVLVNVNLHIGASWNFAKHHRLEIERIFMSALISYYKDERQVNYETNYIMSYSWIF